MQRSQETCSFVSYYTCIELEELSKQRPRCNDQQTFIRIPDTISPSSTFLYRNKQFIIPPSWNSFLRIHCAAIGSILKYSGQLAYQGGLNPPTSVWILRTEEARREDSREKKGVQPRRSFHSRSILATKQKRRAHTNRKLYEILRIGRKQARRAPLCLRALSSSLSIPYAPVFSVSIVAWSGDTKPGERDRGRAP